MTEGSELIACSRLVDSETPPSKNAPRFTVVTPSLNCGRFLPRNLRSIESQEVPGDWIEHWVIDGGSTDDTLRILAQHPRVQFVSEMDRGLSDAVNKGIRRAHGEWILWLNADDELAPGALRHFLDALDQFPSDRIFCGAQKVFDYEGQLVGVTSGWDYRLPELLGPRTAILQASTFVHRSVYETVGLLDESFRYAMDYEWTVRAMHRFSCRPLPWVLTHYHWRRGSIMDAGIAGQHREFLRVRRQHGRSYFEPAEWRIRFYLATDCLRRNRELRKAVQRIKARLGFRSSGMPSVS